MLHYSHSHIIIGSGQRPHQYLVEYESSMLTAEHLYLTSGLDFEAPTQACLLAVSLVNFTLAKEGQRVNSTTTKCTDTLELEAV